MTRPISSEPGRRTGVKFFSKTTFERINSGDSTVGALNRRITDAYRNPHISAGPAPIRLQNRHALACGPLQPGEKPHAHAWRFCSHTMQPEKAYVRITALARIWPPHAFRYTV